MKLKAPPGVGDPCVASVALAARDGLYGVVTIFRCRPTNNAALGLLRQLSRQAQYDE